MMSPKSLTDSLPTIQIERKRYLPDYLQFNQQTIAYAQSNSAKEVGGHTRSMTAKTNANRTKRRDLFSIA
jgi:hypothetical protein